MKSLILPLAVAALTFSSCVSSYKTGQTPDDVYYSPTRPADEYVQTEKKQDNKHYQGTDEYYEDRYLHMRAQNRYRWSVLDDYYYNTPYAYNYYGSSWTSPYNSYWCWNNYYNPYYYSYNPYVIIKNPKTYIAPPSRPIAFNPNSYIGGGTSKPSSRYVSSYNSNSGSGRYNNSNGSSSSGFSKGLQKVFSSSNSSSSSYNGSSSTPSRSYSPSSSTSSSSGSSSRSSGSSSSSSGSSRPNR